MRCRRPLTCIARDVLPIVLMLAAAPTAVFAQWGPQRARVRAELESPACHAIRRGESARQAARRITGDGRNTYQAWFQIMNASSRFVPKSQYDRVRAGWRACVIKPAIESTLSIASHFKAPEASNALEVPEALVAPGASATAGAREGAGENPQSVASDVLRMFGTWDLTIVWLGAAMVVPWFGWRIVDEYLARRKSESIVVRHFADRFVHEFERPLVRYYAAEHPVRSRLRCSARRGRFDILLAPREGRQYPNLLDHKKNVEYDVARVLHVLADESFVGGPLYVQGGWVVVPFQFKTDLKQAGVTCISSF